MTNVTDGVCVDNLMYFEYWCHCRAYPGCTTVTDDMLDEMAGVLLNFLTGIFLFLLIYVYRLMNRIIAALDTVWRPEITCASFRREDIPELLALIEPMKRSFPS